MTLSASHVLAIRSVLVDFEWLISGAGLIASSAGVVVGPAVIMLSLPRGRAVTSIMAVGTVTSCDAERNPVMPASVTRCRRSL
jgi:hypothetical protein